MTTIDAEIRAAIDAFANQLSSLVRKAALNAITAALNGAPVAGSPARQARALPAPSSPRGRPAAKKARVARKWAKRDPKIIAKLTEQLAAHVAAHPGQGIRQIGKALGAPTHDLELPTKKLLAGKRIKKRGQRSETRYFPA